jgi:hypothetical protein
MHTSLAVNGYYVTILDQDSGHFQGFPSTRANHITTMLCTLNARTRAERCSIAASAIGTDMKPHRAPSGGRRGPVLTLAEAHNFFDHVESVAFRESTPYCLRQHSLLKHYDFPPLSRPIGWATGWASRIFLAPGSLRSGRHFLILGVRQRLA